MEKKKNKKKDKKKKIIIISGIIIVVIIFILNSFLPLKFVVAEEPCNDHSLKKSAPLKIEMSIVTA